MRRGALSLGALLAASSGCTPTARWGDEARYAPDVRGYVIARPGPPRLVATPVQLGEADVTRRILLRDPITGEKLRCREQLDPYLVPITREAATVLHDERAALTVTLPVAMAMPTTWAGTIFSIYVGAPLMAPVEGLRQLMSSPSAGALYARGKRAFDQQRFADAESLLERALAKGRDRPGDAQRAAYLLGILYAQDGRSGDASRALRAFVARADVRAEAAYEDAEKRLAALEPAALTSCRSQAPLAFAWPKPR